MKSRFNDDYYAVRIAEWERERIPAVVWHARFEWGVPVAIGGALILTLGNGRYSWSDWFAFVFVGYLVLHLFVFLHEVNENVRFVRHKLQEQREAHERLADQFRRYKDPARITVFDAIEGLDREWGD